MVLVPKPNQTLTIEVADMEDAADTHVRSENASVCRFGRKPVSSFSLEDLSDKNKSF